MSKRIYVGNLPWSVDKVRFEELFSPFGEIEEALVIANKYTGRSRGFGFVTYKNDADADKAMEEMNEKEVEGRNLVVKVARPSRESQGEGAVEEEQKPKEKKQEPAEEKTPSAAELKEKLVKKSKKEEPAEETKEETEEK
jgi:RNA recognition motif-containing protein